MSKGNGTQSTHCVLMFVEHLPRRTLMYSWILLIIIASFREWNLMYQVYILLNLLIPLEAVMR